MKAARPDFSHLGFFKTFVLPALWVFVLPVLSLLFFQHAQAKYDALWRAEFLNAVQANRELTPQQRAEAIAGIEQVPMSTMMLNEQFAAQFPDQTRSAFATFRWMIRVSWASILGGAGVFVLGGLCVLASLRSHFAQYLSLLIGWQVLRLYSAVQTIAFGILIVALSFWVTALWFEVYYVKLIVIAGIIALIAVAAVLIAIFKRPKIEHVVEGVVLPKDEGSRLWSDLRAICDKVGATPPDQIVAGVDDNFFVTENPITVEGQKLTGKSLFVSLALLKQLHAKEAEAVLAHEMAHFSGQDTLYSKRIAPLMMRYEAYLSALYENPLTKPVFYFMLCFHALFSLSLSRLSRQREFRADRLAQEATSARDFAGALLRIAAYSKFRTNVEQELFRQEQALATADISDRIAAGFPAFAVAFAGDPQLGETETIHPFDSHPPMSQRLQALGVSFSPEEARSYLQAQGDGYWYHLVPAAEELERAQWLEFEERFRSFHEETLPYRFLPETAEEQAVVERMFPAKSFEGKDSTLTIDFEKLQHPPSDLILFKEITQWALDDHGTMTITYDRGGKKTLGLKLKKFPQLVQQEILGTFQRYYSRYLAAVEYQKQKQAGLI